MARSWPRNDQGEKDKDFSGVIGQVRAARTGRPCTTAARPEAGPLQPGGQGRRAEDSLMGGDGILGRSTSSWPAPLRAIWPRRWVPDELASARRSSMHIGRAGSSSLQRLWRTLLRRGQRDHQQTER